MNDKTVSLLNKWSEKLGISVPNLTTQLNKLIEQSKRNVPEKTEDFYESRARSMLGSQLAPLLRSRATPFHCYFFGIGEKRDTNQREFDRKKQLFVVDKDKALFDGETDAAGVPLDTKEYFVQPTETSKGRKNPNCGKPLKPFFQKSVIGLAKRFSGGSVKVLRLTMRQAATDFDIPLGKPVLSRLNIRQDRPDCFICTSSALTSFVPAEFPEVAGKTIMQLLMSAPQEQRPHVLEVAAWHAANAKDPTRFCIVTGDVIFKRDTPTDRGSYMISLGDVEEDIEFAGITVFVPGHLKDQLDFGRGSKVIVVGRTSLGRNLMTDEMDQVNVNAYGVYCIPEHRVAPGEEEVFLPQADTTVSE